MRQNALYRLALLAALSLGLSSCQAFQEDLAMFDLPNLQSVFFDLNCGDYTYHTYTVPELCGGGKDSFGFLYADDKVIKLILSPSEGEETYLYIPSATILLHSDYLKAGQTLERDQMLATCSRFRKENGNDPTYYTEPAAEARLKVVEHKGEFTHRILDDQTRWVFEWELSCPQLQMTAKGKDQIDISRDPAPATWARADGGPLPPAPRP